MKNNFPYVSLKDLTSKIGSGATPKGGKESYKESGITLIRSMNIYDYQFSREGLAFIDENQANKLKNVIVKKDDVLLNITGASVCRCAMVPSDLLPARVNQHVAIVRAERKKLDPRFALYAINSSSLKQGLFNLAMTGATREALTKNDIENFKLPLPPIKIQKKISAILSSYDDLIENNKRRIALLEKMAEEIYREWFVRFRFPGYQTSEFEKGVPKEWETKTFRELVSYYIGGGWGEEEQSGTFSEGAYVIRGTDIPPLAGGNYSNKVYRYHKPSNLKSRKLQKNDFIFEVSGGSKDQLLGRNLMVSEGLLELFENKVMCASFCKQIRFDDEQMSPYFMKYYLKLYYECNLVGIYQVQSTGISNYQFESFLNYQTLSVPKKELLKKFDELVKPIIAQQEKLALSNLNLEKTKESLLPRLISGKLSVADLDIQFPPSMVGDEAA